MESGSGCFLVDLWDQNDEILGIQVVLDVGMRFNFENEAELMPSKGWRWEGGYRRLGVRARKSKGRRSEVRAMRSEVEGGSSVVRGQRAHVGE